MKIREGSSSNFVDLNLRVDDFLRKKFLKIFDFYLCRKSLSKEKEKLLLKEKPKQNFDFSRVWG